ncbi:hypothetical protein PHYPSEUDO_011476 [Phytophthora pseudosyringae]|uniref:Cystathionine gamma-synthase n=1 Tax=Phytophthora pseudosyringae TaxID=221518 RepID=A0A8T1WAB5_9STRA|nr:hypothetical protein PHYPSEUDO_011476 [Phytophthora pseudosyringae]
MSALTPQPLGVSLPPQDANAISVSMPHWEHVVGYEEGRAEVLDAMACGYPRFFRHPSVVALQRAVQNQISPQDDLSQWEVMVVPTSAVAERLRRFLLDSNSASVEKDEVAVHIVENAVHAVRFPRRIGDSAKQFWQHSGEIVSSRQAEKLLRVLASDAETKAPAVGQSASHLALKKRVAGLYLPSGDADKVALYPTGMAGIFATVRLLQKLRGNEYKSILVGFPYVDTLKILSRKEWCAQGVHFFPTCGEKEMEEMEAIVAKEKVLGIWTEFPSNPLLSMADLKRLAKCAHDNGTVLVVDDTVGSYNVNTMMHGCADVVVTSLSKIFSGTGNVMGGSVVLNPQSPKIKELETIFDPEGDSFIVEDDVEALLEQSTTLEERLAKTNATTAEIVQRLQKHPLVKEVFYPTLGDAKNLYDPFLNPSGDQGKPRYGPLLSILLRGGLEPATAFYNAMTTAKGPSLGTNFTLSCPYTLLAHFGELDFVESCGVDRNLIRISIGQEDPEVIWADFEQAFAAASAFIARETAESEQLEVILLVCVWLGGRLSSLFLLRRAVVVLSSVQVWADGMSPAVSTASSWSSVQSRVTTPRSMSRTRSAWNEEEVDGSSSLNNSRYRVLDANQKQRETKDVERIVSNLEAQRRYRTTSSRPKRSSSRQEAAVVPIRSGSPRLKTKSTRLKASRSSSGRLSFEDMSGEGDESLPVSEKSRPGDAVSQSFQDQVLGELRKLKEAQRSEFEALERLQREKDEAERKSRRLEQKLREQRRQLYRKEGDKSTRNSDATRELRSRPDIFLREDSEDENRGKAYSSNNDSDTGDACDKDESGEEGDSELSDWGDETKSPPPYFTSASPATSPFKRSSGWPAWGGDESLPPGPSSEPQECSSPEPTKPLSRRSRSRSKLDTFSSARSLSNSAISSHVRRLSQSRSRSPSATRLSRSTRDIQELRRSCAFFEDKARAQAEAEQLAKEAAERLERACHAAPPQKLLERQALAQQRRSQQLQELEREMRAEYAREKQAKAREVPSSTYLSAGDAEEAEQKRIERIRQRATEMMQSAELPPRMAVATKNATLDGTEGHVTVKLNKKLRAAAEEQARRQKRQPKPVPNFDQLHSKWEAALKKRKELGRRQQDEEEIVNDDTDAPSKMKTSEFFTSRAAKLAELQEKKEARQQRLKAKEEAMQQHAKRGQDKLLARARASLGKDVGSQRKPTKAETLRLQKLTAEAAKQQKERQREERDADARERRREEAARRVRAQVKRSENVRRDNFAGNLVELKDLDAVSKEKAREQRQQFKEAIARNKEKLLAATAARPSLMERFTTGVKRETHRRAALEAVVKTVFQNDLSALKGVLTNDEQELAREMVAADDDNDDDKIEAS